VRLPFPDRVPLIPVFLSAILLCSIQLLEGTNAIFSLCCFGFILIAGVAFNVAGGFSRSTGAYVFFFAFLAVICGLVWKAILGEPADSNLLVPLDTARVYLGSICAMLGAVYISRKISSKHPLLATLDTTGNLQSTTIGCMVTGIVISILNIIAPPNPGSILSAVNQINRFFPLAVMLGVIHAIRRSGGTRSISIPVIISGGIMLATGILGFSKEGMIAPFLCWLLGAASQRYKMSRSQIVGAILGMIFMFQYMVPLSQIGRGSRADTFAGNVVVVTSFMLDIGNVRLQYLEDQEYQDEALAPGYFNTHQGFFDRLQMIGPDDSLIAYTESTGTVGLFPIILYFENFVPHSIWPDKPTWGGGNLYAREMGIVANEDTTTGISFSPASESFHLGGWTGLLIVAPLLWIAMFTIFDSLCGDMRKAPWGLIVALLYAHLAPEGGLGGVVYAMGYIAVAVWVAAFVGTYLMPIVGQILIGPPQVKTRSNRLPHGKPNLVRPIKTSAEAPL
jgi:hypothetical protein